MQIARPVGREAASRKYDILSALMAFALSQDKNLQRLVMRLMVLITARYNWQRDELSMGQGDIARLWCVDERTVKREMAKLRSKEWLIVKRQGARGRVSLYGLNLQRILDDTKPVWPNLGPDFASRVGGTEPAPETNSNIVPLRPAPAAPKGASFWEQVQVGLYASDVNIFQNWFQPLVETSIEEACLTLTAPNRFHANFVQTHYAEKILSEVQKTDPSISRVLVLG